MEGRSATLRVTALTDFLLAGESLLFAGLLFGRAEAPFSARWFWAAALAGLGLSALLGGIDHGFLEGGAWTGRAHPAHAVVRRLTGLTVGLLSGCTLLCLGREFFPGQPPALFAVLAGAWFLLFAALYLPRAPFHLALACYAPVLLLFLALNLLRPGGRGSPLLAAGLGLAVLSSALQAARVDRFHPFDRNGLYHLVLMASAVFLYAGGPQLS